MKQIALIMGVIAFIFSGSAAIAGDASPIYTGTFNNKAVGGYDTVSYFTAGGPVKGDKNIKTRWRGANWYFSTQENLELFQADPEKYAPQYGGYCAWAVAHDSLVKGDPKIWNITDGKLYLNYDKRIADKWTPRKDELINTANGIYPNKVDVNKE